MSYTYTVETDYRSDVPQTVFLNADGSIRPLKFRGLAGHTSEGEPGRQGAIWTTDYVVGIGTASYHEFWCWEPERREFVRRRIVPPHAAAWSMNPRQPPDGPWNPDADTRRILDDLWWNPNEGAYAAAFAGKLDTDLKAALADPDFRDGCARATEEICAELALPLPDKPLFTHAQGQPTTRRDWGTDLTPTIYAEITRRSQAMTWHTQIKTIRPYTATVVKSGAIRTAPNLTSAALVEYAPADLPVIVVGHVAGDTFSTYGNEWMVFIDPTRGLLVSHSVNRRDSIEYVTPAELQTQLKALRDEHAAQVSGLNATIAERDASISKLNEDLHTAAVRESELRELVDEVSEERDAARVELETVKTELVESEEQVQTLVDQLTEKDDLIASLRTELGFANEIVDLANDFMSAEAALRDKLRPST